MSILSSILTEKTIHIATDTIVCTLDLNEKVAFPGVVIGHHSKIVDYPQLRCSVVGMGATELCLLHDQWVKRNYFNSLPEMYDRTIAEFLSTIPKYGEYIEGEDNMVSALTMFGYHNEEEKLASYSVQILRGGVVKFNRVDFCSEAEGFRTLMSPRLTQEEEDFIIKQTVESGGTIDEALFALCTELVVKSKKEETFEFPVGGEFIYTVISIESGRYVTSTSNMKKFHTYYDDLQRIDDFWRK